MAGSELPWDESGWLAEATDWVHAQVRGRGWQVRGPLELLHQRPWSSFARQATDHGPVYFKAPAPGYAEAGVTQALARWRPDCTLPLLAVDLARGWLLSVDGGASLESLGRTPDQIEHWLKILPRYAEFQIEMVPRVAELLALGIYDRRPSRLPQLYEELLGNTESLRLGLEPGLTAAEYQCLLDLRPQVAAWCQELAEYGLPDTLTHEELHDANVLVSGERYLFTDWSDASVAHPFFTMLVTVRAAAHRLKLGEYGEEMRRLRDAYLESWRPYASYEKLLAAYRLAYRLAMLNRALSWHYGTCSLAWKHREAYADFVPGWLQDFLNSDGRV